MTATVKTPEMATPHALCPQPRTGETPVRVRRHDDAGHPHIPLPAAVLAGAECIRCHRALGPDAPTRRACHTSVRYCANWEACNAAMWRRTALTAL